MINCKVNFEELKGAIGLLNKAVKKNPLEVPLIKMEAKATSLVLTVNCSNSIGAEIEIPATVNETGVFVTTFSSVNVISVRNCTGNVTITSPGENSLAMKYKGGKATTSLTAVDTTFNDVAAPDENCTKVALPIASLKEMFKEVEFSTSDDVNKIGVHSVKMDVHEDSDGLLKFSLSACDGRTIAIRSAYTMQNGNYTGTSLILPEQMKSVLDVLNGDDGDAEISFGNGKVFVSYKNRRTCFQEISASFPNIEGILKEKNCLFTVKISRADMLEALNAVLYIQNELKAAGQTNESVSFEFSKDEVSIGCTGTTQFSEEVPIQTEGELLESKIYFSASALKEILSCYPNDEVIIGGSTTKAPFWMCCGDNDEYVYCIMPRAMK